MSTVGKDWKGKKDDKGDDEKKLSVKVVRQRDGSHERLPND